MAHAEESARFKKEAFDGERPHAVSYTHLDVYKRQVIAVSHDRYFLDRVVNRIFAFEGQGKVTQYEMCIRDRS